jgi:hypothetical protein
MVLDEFLYQQNKIFLSQHFSDCCCSRQNQLISSRARDSGIAAANWTLVQVSDADAGLNRLNLCETLHGSSSDSAGDQDEFKACSTSRYLAAWVLRDKPEWTADKINAAMNGDQTIQVNLDKPIPVLILYTTAVVEPDGEVRFFRDIYKYDSAMEQALASGYPYASQ